MGVRECREILLGGRKFAWGWGRLSGARSVAEGEKNLRGVRGFCLAGVIFDWSWAFALLAEKSGPTEEAER